MRRGTQGRSGPRDSAAQAPRCFSQNRTAMKRRNLLKTAILLPAALRPAPLLPQGRVYRPDFEPRNVEIAPSAANHTLDGRALPIAVAEQNAAARPMILNDAQRATLRRLADEIVPGAGEAGAGEFLEFLAASSPQPTRQQFAAGLDGLEQAARRRHNRSFSELGASEVAEVLSPLREAWIYQPATPLAAFLRQTKSDLWRFTHTGDGPRTYWYDIT